jgi:hypothetical protein
MEDPVSFPSEISGRQTACRSFIGASFEMKLTMALVSQFGNLGTLTYRKHL